MSSPPALPPPLLTAVDCRDNIHLIIGSGSLANARCSRSIEVGAAPKLIAPPDADVHYLLTKQIERGEVEWIKRSFRDEDVMNLGRGEVGSVVDAVFMTSGTSSEKRSLFDLCKRNRIPVNIIDAPALCTFTLLSTHADGPLQIGITTSGNGCKLASRIRREIATTLPPHFGAAVARLGALRRRILDEDQAAKTALNHPAIAKPTTTTPELDQQEEEDESTYPTSQPSSFNHGPPSASSDNNRRVRWLAQICEYYPLSHLTSLTPETLTSLLSTSPTSSSTDSSNHPNIPNPKPPPLSRRKPLITLAGAGPGTPSLLTLATHHHIQTADLILADKLVPSPILALIPRRTRLIIARKFPGNADAAQDELLSLALEGLRRGETVLRLKQGDPFVYGRGGEEVEFFRREGWEAVVIPGITSALAAPLCAGIPPTHRGVADQILVSTGTGRKGATIEPPEFVEGRTVVFLMALHRVGEVVGGMVGEERGGGDAAAVPPQKTRLPWPTSTPCTIIERASLPDQRVIRTTLRYVVRAVEALGSRPPGLMVVGAGCGVGREAREELRGDGDGKGNGDAKGQGEGAGRKIVKWWQEGWVVEEGGWGDGLSGMGELDFGLRMGSGGLNGLDGGKDDVDEGRVGGVDVAVDRDAGTEENVNDGRK